MSRRWLQDFIKEHPFYRMAGRKKLFTANDIRDLHQVMPAPEGPRVFVRQIGGAQSGQSKTHWKDVIARIQRDQEAEKAARRAKREQECVTQEIDKSQAGAQSRLSAVDTIGVQQGGQVSWFAPFPQQAAHLASRMAVDRTLLSLAEAARLIFPDGLVKESGLRREFATACWRWVSTVSARHH